MTDQLMRRRSVAASLILALAVLGTAFVASTKAQTPEPKPTVKGKAASKVRTLIDLNKATAEEMVEALPGVGEVTARKVVDGRPYKSVDELSKVGVPPRTIEAIRSLVTFGSTATEKASPTLKAAAEEKKDSPTGAASARVNLNTATVEELQTLPGVGPALAKEILAARPFKAVEELEKVKGLGQSRVQSLRSLVTVEPTAKLPASGAAKAAVASPRPTTATKPALTPGKLVNINKAPKAELDLLPGIGPVKADAILEYRKANPFKSKEDIMKVRGIKEGEFAKIKGLITVD